MSIRAATGIGEFLYNKSSEYFQAKIAERVGPFTPKEGEFFYHGTQQGPQLGPDNKFITDRNLFAVFKNDKAVARKFAAGTGESWKRQDLPGEERSQADGTLLKLTTEVYYKTYFGGIPYIPPGKEVHVVKETAVKAAPVSPADAVRSSIRESLAN